MSTASDLTERFAARFAGLDRVHGCYRLPKQAATPGQKQQGNAVTKREPPTLALYQAHLAGAYGLGIVPIRDDGTVVWGALDVDQYSGLDHAALAARSERLGLPLLWCQSKSGGAHGFLFCREDVPAPLMQAKLRTCVGALGLPDTVELFPKQARLAGPDDCGSWVNLPYHGTSDRRAVMPDGEVLTLDAFLDVADRVAVTADQLAALEPAPADDDGLGALLTGAPPCLVTLARRGLGEGERNKGLFNMAVYLRKRHGDGWEDYLDALNQRFAAPPVGHRELTQITRNVNKRAYHYTCADAPIQAVCQRDVCATCTYGVPADQPGDKPGSQADRLLALVPEAECWQSAEGRGYVRLNEGGVSRDYPATSKALRLAVVGRYESAHKRAPGAGAVRDVQTVLEARAAAGPVYPVHVRWAGHRDRLYLDLGDAAGRVVEMAGDLPAPGWRVVARDTAPVRFVRPPSQLPLPEPVAGGSLDDFRPFVHVGPEPADWHSALTFLVQAPRATGPYLHGAVVGEQGSAKSTTVRVFAALLDPTIAGVRALPDDERDLVIAAEGHHLLAFDNVSAIPDAMSDALSRLSTGGGLGTRELYSDRDETVFNVMRPVLWNGITADPGRQDLAERTLVLDLPPLDPEARRDERSFWAAFEVARPALLGALCTACATALHHLPTTRLPRLPRMADAALWVTAAEPALGWAPGTALRALEANQREARARALDHDAVARAAILTAREAGAAGLEIGGTPQHLLDLFTLKVGPEVARTWDWPKTPRGLSGRLRRAAPGLRGVGVLVEFGRGDARRITLRLAPGGLAPSTRALAEEQEAM